MKVLVGLALVQTVAIGFLGLKVVGLSAQTRELAAIEATKPAPTGGAPALPESTLASAAVIDSGNLTADDIRLIVREEIAPLKGALSTAPGQAATAKGANALSDEQVKFMRDSVVKDLDFYAGQGRMSELEMATLQGNIARLPPTQRREMLSRLTKALSDGDIDAQL